MQTRIEDRKLIIEIDLDGQQGTTSNGNISIASTKGWLKIENGVSLSLNLVRSVKKSAV